LRDLVLALNRTIEYMTCGLDLEYPTCCLERKGDDRRNCRHARQWLGHAERAWGECHNQGRGLPPGTDVEMLIIAYVVGE